MKLLDVQNLRVRFETHHGVVRAVDGVSFQLEEGETLGLVGESGSGKSVTNLALMGLVPQPPGVVEADGMLFGGRDLLRMTEREFRQVRGNEISMIFQDPMTSLNPLLTVGRQLTEVIEVHEKVTRKDARRRAAAGGRSANAAKARMPRDRRQQVRVAVAADQDRKVGRRTQINRRQHAVVPNDVNARLFGRQDRIEPRVRERHAVAERRLRHERNVERVLAKRLRLSKDACVGVALRAHPDIDGRGIDPEQPVGTVGGLELPGDAAR